MAKNILLNDDHLFLTSSSDIDEISRPLKQSLGITSFVYQRNFEDSSEIRLTNQPSWVKHFYQKGYYQISGFEKHPAHYQTGLVVWSHLTHHQPILQDARRFNIAHGLTLIEKTQDGCEFYFIGTTPEQPQITNLILNNLEFLKRFILYFKEKAKHLLKSAYSQRIFIHQKYDRVITSELGIPFQQKALDPNKLLNLKKISITNKIFLTAREITCAQLILEGKSARLIAEQLFLSPRTVEKHIEHLKAKFQCHSKPELISKLMLLNIL